MRDIYEDYGPQGACAPKTAWALGVFAALLFTLCTGRGGWR